MSVKFYFFDDLPAAAFSVIEDFVNKYKDDVIIMVEPREEFYLAGNKVKPDSINKIKSGNNIPLFLAKNMGDYSPLYWNKGILGFATSITLENPLFSPRKYVLGIVKRLSEKFDGSYNSRLGQVYINDSQVFASYFKLEGKRLSYNGWISVNPVYKKGVINKCLTKKQGSLNIPVQTFINDYAKELFSSKYVTVVDGDEYDSLKQELIYLSNKKKVDDYV